jgi:hypothetical protein
MTDFVEVYNAATGRNEIIPEDWLDSPVLGKDVNGDPLERVVPVSAEVAAERPTASSKHDVIDAFAKQALGKDFVFPEGTKTREEKMAVLDELAPAAAEPPDIAPPVPESEPGVQLTGPVSTESVIPALNNPTQAEDEEN